MVSVEMKITSSSTVSNVLPHSLLLTKKMGQVVFICMLQKQTSKVKRDILKSMVPSITMKLMSS